MIVLALVLLTIVLVFSVAIVLSNPDVYQLSLFRVLVPVTSAGVFFTGFGAALVTITALLLLRTGIRRSRETRRRLRAADQAAAGTDSTPDRSDAAASDVPDSGPDGSGQDRPGDPGVADRRVGESEPGRVDEPRTTDPADGPVPSGPDLDEGADATTVPADRRTAAGRTDDRDEPRI